MSDIVLYADLPSGRQSSVISVTRALHDEVQRALGADIMGRGILERGGPVARAPVGWFHAYAHQLHGVPLHIHKHRIAGLQIDSVADLSNWRRLMRDLHAAYFPSTWCEEIFRPHMPEKCETMVVPHGISRPEPTEPEPLQEQFTVLFLASFSWKKEHFLRKGLDVAVRGARQAGVELVARVNGVGQDMLGYCDPASRVHVIDRYLAPKELSELYRAVHAVMVPSRSEAFGLVAAEALAHGVPVIATSDTGMRDYLPDDERVEIIKTRGERQLHTYGRSDGYVSEVRTQDVAAAIERMKIDYDERRLKAEALADQWVAEHCWEKSASPLVNWIRDRI